MERKITDEYRNFVYTKLGAAVPIEETDKDNVVDIKIPFEVRLTKDFASFLRKVLEEKGLVLRQMLIQPVHVQDLKEHEQLDFGTDAKHFQIKLD